MRKTLALTVVVVMAALATSMGPATASQSEPREVSIGSLAPASVDSPSRRIESVQEPTWLQIFNYYRAMAGLQSVTENPAWSDGIRKHAIYSVKTRTFGHSEDPASPWFTPEGDAAARSSNLVGLGGEGMEREALMGWLHTPFHGIGMLDPRLAQSGYGTYAEDAPWGQVGASGLDVIRGGSELPPDLEFPIEWPPEGSIVPFVNLQGEWPNPLTACPGKDFGWGFPLMVQWAEDPQVTAHSLMQGDQRLDHCVLDESTYVNPEPAEQSLGRSVLGARNAVVLIPREPLVPGRTYTASVTSRGTRTAWSFTVSSFTVDVLPLSVSAGREITAAFAKFEDSEPYGAPSEYDAVINWGDGSRGRADVVQTEGKTFEVVASHIFSRPGEYRVEVTAVDRIFGRESTGTGMVRVDGDGWHDRSVSFSLRGHLTARGQVTAADGFVPCKAGSEVIIERLKARGRWTREAITESNSNGHYRLVLQHRRADFRARIQDVAVSGEACAAALSPVASHFHRPS